MASIFTVKGSSALKPVQHSFSKVFEFPVSQPTQQRRVRNLFDRDLGVDEILHSLKGIPMFSSNRDRVAAVAVSIIALGIFFAASFGGVL